MAAPVYTRRLFIYRSDVVGPHVGYIAPPGQSTIIRSVTIASLNSVTGGVYVYIEPTSGSVVYLYSNAAFPANGAVQLDIRQELLPGEKLSVNATILSVSFAATGYMFPVSA